MEQVFLNTPEGMTIVVNKTNTRVHFHINYNGVEAHLDYPVALGRKGLKQAVVNAIEKVTHG